MNKIITVLALSALTTLGAVTNNSLGFVYFDGTNGVTVLDGDISTVKSGVDYYPIMTTTNDGSSVDYPSRQVNDVIEREVNSEGFRSSVQIPSTNSVTADVWSAISTTNTIHIQMHGFANGTNLAYTYTEAGETNSFDIVSTVQVQSGAPATIVSFAWFKNGTICTCGAMSRLLSTAGDVGSWVVLATPEVTNGDVLELRVRANKTTTVTIPAMQFIARVR